MEQLSLRDDRLTESSKMINDPNNPNEKETSFLDSFVKDLHDLQEGLNKGIITIQSHDPRGQTLLHRSVVTRGDDQPRRAVVEYLLEHGANPNLTDANGLSAFMYDTFNGKSYFGCFSAWLKADPKRILTACKLNKNTGMDVMMHVASAPRTPYDAEMVTLLLKGADKDTLENIRNERDALGRNAVFYAALSTHQNKATYTVVKNLFDMGFDPAQTDIYGQNIAHIIASNPDINVDLLDLVLRDELKNNQILKQSDEDMNTPAHVAGEAQNFSAFSKIKGHPIDYTERNSRGETSLMCLCKNLTSPSSTNLALKGLTLPKDYINAVDNNGNTALAYVLLSMSSTGCTDSAIRQVIKLLTGMDANTNVKNVRGMSPEQLAVFLNCSGFLRYNMGLGVEIV